jgi:DNA-binding NarL/FixJ family response regulator
VKIILTDYYKLFRSGVRTCLEPKNDIEIVGEAGNGQELMELLNEIIPDIIIMDVQMPVMDGFETLLRIRKKFPDLKVIIMSIHTDPAIISEMMRLGANTYLGKNCNSETIYQAIRCVFEYNYYYSEAIKTAWLGSDIRFERMGHEYTSKELDIIKFQKEGKSAREIAQLMDISERTVLAMLDKLKRKMNQ